ncbi:MAG: hypothetical protein JRD47_06555, partial [Deltaproteobacteria bacterium]|nr:hypothetical protein [Deltaproteobacteria bacterium]
MNEQTHDKGQDRITVCVKGLTKDTIYALKRSYSPLFYDLMRVLHATKYKKETRGSPAL